MYLSQFLKILQYKFKHKCTRQGQLLVALYYCARCGDYCERHICDGDARFQPRYSAFLFPLKKEWWNWLLMFCYHSWIQDGQPIPGYFSGNGNCHYKRYEIQRNKTCKMGENTFMTQDCEVHLKYQFTNSGTRNRGITDYGQQTKWRSESRGLLSQIQLNLANFRLISKPVWTKRSIDRRFYLGGPTDINGFINMIEHKFLTQNFTIQYNTWILMILLFILKNNDSEWSKSV